MSFNQPRYQKSEASQDRKTGRSASFSQQRTSSGAYSKGGAPAASPSLSSSRSFKKSNNAQGGQSRVNVRPPTLPSEPSNAPTQHNLQNGAHLPPQPQPQPQHHLPVTVSKPADTVPASHRAARPVPKAPTSQSAAMSSETMGPSTPKKASGDASAAFSFQFGSLSPGLVNGMQIPARTSSAPPNLDEQIRDQVRHDTVKSTPPVPVPPASKHHPSQKRDVGTTDQSNSGDVHVAPKAKKDQVQPVPPAVQSQKPSAHHVPGISMQMPFSQPQVPIHFNNPSTQIQSQGMASASLQMQIPLPMLPVANAPSPMQQQMFVGLQPHVMQSQGMMHQGQGLNFGAPMNPQFSAQLGSLGMGITSYSQQGAKFGGPRKTPVKITHPETHQEVRLDKRTEGYSEGGPASRSHLNVTPESQHISSFSPSHPIKYYPNYNASRFNPVNQGAQKMTSMKSQENSLPPDKIGISVRPAVEPLNEDHARDPHAAPLAMAQGISKPKIGTDSENIADLSSASVITALETVDTPAALRVSGDSASQESEAYRGSLPNDEQASKAWSLPGSNKEYAAVAGVSGESSVIGSEPNNCASPDVHSSVSINAEGRRREIVGRSDKMKDTEHKQGNKGNVSSQIKVGKEANLDLDGALQASSSIIGGFGIEEAKTNSISAPGISEDVSDSMNSNMSEVKCDSAREGTVSASSEISGAGLVHEVSQEIQCLNQDNSSERNYEVSDVITADEGELGSEGPLDQSQESTDGSKTSSVPVSLKYSEIVKQGDLDSVSSVKASSKEISTDETKKNDLNEECPPVGSMNGISEMSTSPSIDSSIAEVMPSTADPSASAQDADPSIGRSDEVVDSASVLNTNSLKTSMLEGDGTENLGGSVRSVQVSGSKGKPSSEMNRSSSTISRGRKKRKEYLQKADAAGATLDLYMAYKGPEEKKEAVMSPNGTEAASDDINSKNVPPDSCCEEPASGDGVLPSKAEPDDWEDAADDSSRSEPSGSGQRVDEFVPSSQDRNGFLAKKYSRDFLLKFAEKCTDLPENFVVTNEIAEAFIPSVNISRFPDRDSHPSPGRMTDRQSSGARLDRRGSNIVDDDKWSKMAGPFGPGRDLRVDVGFGNSPGFRPGQGGNYGVLRNPRAQSPGFQGGNYGLPYAGGILLGPMQSPGFQGGGMQRNSPDADRWQRATNFQQKGLIPSPQTPLQTMHKADKKYEVGKVTDEEEAKQRQLKAILNKLTPQNFEKLFEKVKAVNIDNATTLTGLISQIFDKALMEPTFCEMYANLCCQLAQELPDFSEDNKKITFKRLLLNKCQEEFERGEREQEEANKAEEGEIKQSDEEREEKRIKARRRMLGNIRLIGELYKKRMLTEKIMHECIKQLLGQHETPDEEDIEALCKLMSTIGEMIDHSKAKDHIDAYFDRMATLSNNMNLSSRVRFMLKDTIDLRKNKWQQRRKVEGPKKIEEVHRDAAQERQAQVSRLGRAPGINPSRRVQPDYSSRASSMSSSSNTQIGGFRGVPSQARGFGSQDVRAEERPPYEARPLAVPLPQRQPGDDSHSITLGPQGGLGRGMSFRGPLSMSSTSVADISSGIVETRRMPDGLNGFSATEKTSYGSRDPVTSYVGDRFSGSGAYEQSSAYRLRPGSRDGRNRDNSSDRSVTNSPSFRGLGTPLSQDSPPLEKVWPEERLREMSISAIKEFYSVKDEKELALCIKDLNSPSFYPSMVSLWVTDSFERKDIERDLLVELLIKLSRSQDGLLSQVELIRGFESVLATLEDAVNDAPKAAEFLGRMLGKVIVENVIPLREIGRMIHEGGEEPGRLLEVGLAADVIGSTLEMIKSEKGETVLNEIRISSNLRLEDFRPPHPKSSTILENFI